MAFSESKGAMHFSKLTYLLIRYCLLVGVCCLYTNVGNAQGLCDSNEAIDDGFELLTPAVGCHPFTAKLEDKSGGTDLNYVYYYYGQDASELGNLFPTQVTENPYFSEEEIATFTILQYGKDANGDTFYSCKDVTVRPNTEPRFSYTLCNNSLNIDIPRDEANDFDYYEMDWGDGSIETIQSNQLSFSSAPKNVTFPVTIKLEGYYNNVVLNCPSPASITIEDFSPSTSPNGKELPFHPNIDKIELVSSTEGIMNLSGSFGGNGYALYKAEKGGNYAAPYKTGVNPGEIEFDFGDSTKSYCFYVVRPISCGIEQSAEICTIPFQTLEAVEKENHLVWEAYKTQQFNFPNEPQYGRNQDFTISLDIVENGIENTEIMLNQADFEYFDPVNCKNDFCYRIKVRTEGQLYYFAFQGESISNERCISRKSFQPDSISDLNVSIINQQAIVNYTDNSGWNIDKEMFYYHTFQEDGTLTVDSSNIISPFNSPLDPSSSSYCFKISYRDECGSYSKLSPEVCSILLEITDNETLNWENNQPFSLGEVSSFDIVLDNAQTGASSPIFSALGFQGGNMSPNTESFENEGLFYIKAINDLGNESFSNAVEIPLSSRIFVPTAFSPNGDGINDEFEVFGNFETLNSYEVSIFNRWGMQVYHSEDPEEVWNGDYQGTRVPFGNYSYEVKGVSYRGEVVEHRGLVFIF